MAEGTEPIRQDIDALRDSMSVKMEQIEAKVKGTVDDTVSKVKGTVDDTVNTVKRTFDIEQQVSDRPWAAFAISVIAGYALGTLGDSSGSPRRSSSRSSSYGNQSYSVAPSSTANHESSPASPWQAQPAAPQQALGGFVADVMDQFGGELDSIKTAAVASAVKMLRDFIGESVPQFRDEYDRVLSQREDGSELGSSTVPATSGSASSGTYSSLTNAQI